MIMPRIYSFLELLSQGRRHKSTASSVVKLAMREPCVIMSKIQLFLKLPLVRETAEGKGFELMTSLVLGIVMMPGMEFLGKLSSWWKIILKLSLVRETAEWRWFESMASAVLEPVRMPRMAFLGKLSPWRKMSGRGKNKLITSTAVARMMPRTRSLTKVFPW